MQFIPTRNIAGLFLTASLAFCVSVDVQEARAADGTWNGSISSAWFLPGNWTGSVPGASGVSPNVDIANIASGTANAGSIGIDMSAAGGNYSLGGLSLSGVSNSAIQVVNSSATAGTLNLYGATINSVPNVILRNNSAAAFTLTNGSGAMNVALANVTNNIVNIDGTGNVSVVNDIKDGVVGAKLLLGGSGSGTLILSGANTYTGGTTIRQGTLVWSNNNALSTGAVTVSDANTNGAVAIYRNTTGTLSNDITVANAGTGSVTIGNNTGSTGTTIYNGDVTLDRSATLRGGTGTVIVRFGGTISGAGSVTIDGSGSVQLTGTNTYAGGTTINSGILVLGNNGNTGSVAGNIVNNSSLRFNRFDNVVFAGDISGSGNLSKQGNGVVTLTGNNSYQGGTVLTTATLALGSMNAIGSTGAITFIGGTLQFTSSNTTDYSARFSPANGQNYRLDTNGQSVTLATSLAASTSSLTKSGAGTLTVTAANNYTGGTVVSGGALKANNSFGSATGTGNVVVNLDGTLSGTGSVAGSVTINAGGHLAAGNSIESLAIGTTGANALTFSGTSNFDYEIQTNVALNVAADVVMLTGNLNISPAAMLNFTDLAGLSAVALAENSKFTLISYSGSWDGNTFASKPNNSLVTIGINQFTLKYNDATKGLNFATGVPSGLSYVTLTAVAVPEASVVVFGCALCAVLGLRYANGKRRGKLPPVS
jgi:autotransporter-associated beta strand protein